MATSAVPGSLAGELRELLVDGQRLVRTEVALVAEKGRDALARSTRRAALFAASAVLGIEGLVYALRSVYEALVMRLDPWLAALLTAGITWVVAAVFVMLALRPARDDATRASASRTIVRR